MSWGPVMEGAANTEPQLSIYYFFNYMACELAVAAPPNAFAKIPWPLKSPWPPAATRWDFQPVQVEQEGLSITSATCDVLGPIYSPHQPN